MNIALKDTWQEKTALHKQPKKGKCRESVFANGYHRIGFIPKDCPLDGGVKGFSAHSECLDCGKKFNEIRFYV